MRLSIRSILAVLLLSACGAAGSHPQPVATTDPDEPLARDAVRLELLRVYRIILAGDALLYRGTIEARDDLGQLENHHDHVIAGPVAGWIDTADPRGQSSMLLLAREGDAALELWAPRELPGATGLHLMSVFEWGALLGPTCTACATPIDPAPEALRIDGHGESALGDGRAYHASARGEVVRARWSELDARMLFVLMRRATPAGDPQPELDGDRVRLAVHGAIGVPFEGQAPSDHPHCVRARAYRGTASLHPATGSSAVVIEAIDPPVTRCCTDAPAMCSPAQCVTL